MELQNARFDGRSLEGRILVSATGGPVTLESRPGAQSTVTVKSVLDCLDNEETNWIKGISSPFPPRLTGQITVNGGTMALPGAGEEPDAGIAALPSAGAGQDTASPTFTDDTGKVIPWPKAVQPLAVLDGPAILAAHAALQHVLARFSKEDAKDCAYSSKAMEVMLGQQAGLYFVNVNHKIEQCGWAAPGATFFTDWFEFYAVAPGGRVLARYPYHP